jgi:ElaB/YqjD/DUF883 family membrane-anchored ribosome-binding protein
MKNFMNRAKVRFSTLVEKHPFEWIACCAAIGYFVGRVVESQVDD